MKILPFDVAVLENDTHISKWVEQHGKLQIAEKLLEPVRKYVPEGSVVVDAGAMIGDHTATYSEWVGPTGKIFAFEPNHEAFKCLQYNMRKFPQVTALNAALSDRHGWCSLNRSENAGASHLSEEDGDVCLVPLDEIRFQYGFDVPGNVSFIKIDVEGFETRVLRGAAKTIAENKPVMLIEVNAGALLRAGTSSNELLGLIDHMGYQASMIDSKLLWSDPQFDVLCIPKEMKL